MFNDTVVEEYEHKDHTIKIVYDDMPENPREWGDSLGTMVVNYRDYNLGDRRFESNEAEAMHRGWDFFVRYMRLTKGAKNILPLSVYDHSQIHMYVGRPYTDSYRGWDSSFVGAIFTTQEDIDKMGTPADQVDKVLRAEVEEYDQWGRGEVYGYITYKDDESVDSCFGFYDIKDAKQEAEANV